MHEAYQTLAVSPANQRGHTPYWDWKLSIEDNIIFFFIHFLLLLPVLNTFGLLRMKNVSMQDCRGLLC